MPHSQLRKIRGRYPLFFSSVLSCSLLMYHFYEAKDIHIRKDGVKMDDTFGKRIRSLRKSRNLSQVQLAEKLFTSKQSVSNWENNNILPSVEMLMRTANYFSVSTDFLLGLNDRTYIETTGLTLEELSHIQEIIDDIRKYK